MRRLARLLLSISALVILGCGGTPPRAATSSPAPATAPRGEIGEAVTMERAPARLPESVTPSRYALTMAIAPGQERFTGVAEIDVRVSERTRSIWIHGQGLEVSEVRATESGRQPIAGRWEAVDADEGVARIVLERAIGPGEVRLHLAWSAPFDTTLEGLYRVETGGDPYAFTQFEALAARKAFPSFDEPRWKTPYDVTLVVPAGLGAFANSRELEARELPGGLRSVRFATTEPLPTYLVAWAVGPLDVVEATIPPNEVRTRPLALRGLAARGRGPELAFAMAPTPRNHESLEGDIG